MFLLMYRMSVGRRLRRLLHSGPVMVTRAPTLLSSCSCSRGYARRAGQQRLWSSFLAADTTFEEIGVGQTLRSKLKKLGFVKPSSIQATAAPEILDGKNVIVNAETGTGKTLAYALPILEKLQKNHNNVEGDGQPQGPVVCILVPSQELCSQIAQVFKILNPKTNPVSVYKGTKLSPGSFHQHDIIVGTPSALANKVAKRPFRRLLANVKYFVMDEADILLSATFGTSTKTLVSMAGRPTDLDDDSSSSSRKIDKARIPGVQYIFCAATMLDKNHKIVGQWLDENFFDACHCRTPKFHTLSSGLKVNNIFIDIDPLIENEKTYRELSVNDMIVDSQLEALLRAIKVAGYGYEETERTGGHTLVFANSFAMCEAAADYLNENAPELSSAPLHKEMPKDVREDTVRRFLEGSIDILISTDLMARGMDTTMVQHVVQLECPDDLPSYIHRCGRTARAGRGGLVSNIIPSAQAEFMKELQSNASIGLADTFSSRRSARHKQRRLSKKKMQQGYRKHAGS